ncbi:maleylacetate reductase, partial [Actinomadura roseirufa]|uniref:maleylacetate reductase n=1 Tax=Actinomadura roseirufa TaxID=2094049 RepID=UPI001040EBC7
GAAERARSAAAGSGADGLVAVGGGSAIGLAKAVALTTGLPILAVPTTFAGSEMTPVWGITSGGVKRTGRDRRVLPRTVVYDPVLARSMPGATAAVSGINAMAHAAEALYAPDVTPVGAVLAEEAVRALAAALPAIAGGDRDAVAEGLYGAWLAGACLGSTTMGLHHKLCHVLGGTFGLPHAPTHAVVLPYVLAHNLPAAPEAARRLARALDAADPVAGLRALLDRLGTPRSLAELGLDAASVGKAAELAGRDPYANPRPAGPRELRALLEAALTGIPPVSE